MATTYYYMDQEYNSYEEAFEACQQDLDDNDILWYIRENESDRDVLAAILKGNEEMYFNAVSQATEQRANFYICEEESDEIAYCCYDGEIVCPDPEEYCSECDYCPDRD